MHCDPPLFWPVALAVACNDGLTFHMHEHCIQMLLLFTYMSSRVCSLSRPHPLALSASHWPRLLPAAVLSLLYIKAQPAHLAVSVVTGCCFCQLWSSK